MRIGLYPADDGGCGHYRLIWPGEAVGRAGHDVTIIRHHDEAAVVNTLQQDRKIGVDSSGQDVVVPHVIGLVERPPYDVVVLQRPLHRLLVESIPFLQRAGVAVVVEIDDDFKRLDPRNQVYRSVQPRLSPDRNYEWLQLAVDLADVVTVSTASLAQVYRRPGHPAIVLPNYLPAHVYRDEATIRTGPVTVGWSGQIGTHPDDLTEMGNAIRRLASHPRFACWHTVGSGKGVIEQLGLPDSVPRSNTERWVPFDEYHATLDTLDVGVVPLKPSRFNEGKSWLKGLEYAARGIPSVASPTGPYQSFHRLGGCLLAEDQKQWYRTLRSLLDNADLRRRTADNALRAARSLCIDDHWAGWLAAWAQAYAVRRGA